MTTDEMMTAAKSLSRRRFIEGMTRKDVEQEALLAMLKAQREGFPPSTWKRKADNHLVALWRKLPPDSPSFSEDFDKHDDKLPDSILTAVADKEAFDILVSSLSEREKALMSLCYEHSATDEQIAEAMGFTSARSVQRAKSKIRAKLRETNKAQATL